MQPFQTDLTTITQHLVAMAPGLLMAQKQSELREAPPCDAICHQNPQSRSWNSGDLHSDGANSSKRMEEQTDEEKMIQIPNNL